MKQLAIGLFLAVCNLCSADGLRVALSDFTSDDNSYRSGVAAADFSALVQAQLAGLDGVEWVERSQLKLAEQELHLSAGGIISPSATFRLGKFVKADVMVAGQFVTTPKRTRNLHLELIDTEHADVLAEVVLPVGSSVDKALEISSDEASAAAQALRDAIPRARERLGKVRTQTTVAPLFFANTSGNHRLDYLEDDLQKALTEAATARGGVRILQFPRAQAAAGEAELILAGLVEHDPVAWQKVADVYVWARFEENKVEGVAFENTPVTFTLSFWDGGNEVQGWTEMVKVSELLQLKARMVKRVLDVAQSFKKHPASETARRQVASQLMFRCYDIQTLFQNSPPLHLTAQGQQLWQYQVNLLAVAHFFAPESFLIHNSWLDCRWYRLLHYWDFRGLPELPDLFGQRCEQIRSYSDFASKYGLIIPQQLEGDLLKGRKQSFKAGTANSGLVAYWSIALRMVEEAIGGKEQMSGFPSDAPHEVLTSWRSEMRADLAQRIFEMCETATNSKPPMPLSGGIPASQLMAYVFDLKDKQSRAKFIKDLWPAYLASYDMRTARREFSPEEFDVYFTKRLFVDLRRVFGDVGNPGEAATLIDQFKSKVTIVGNPSAQAEAELSRARRLVALQLLPPELKPELKYVAFSGNSNVHGVVAMVLMERSLWISTRGGSMTTDDQAWEYLVRPHPDSELWRLSTNRDTPEMISAKLGKHSKVTSFCIHEGKLWITLEQDGVFCLTPDTLQLARYGEKEGVLSREMFASAFLGGRLYFGGGEHNRGKLNVVELPALRWRQQDLKSDSASSVVLLQPLGQELLVNDRLLDASNGKWQSVSDIFLKGYPYRSTKLMQIPNFGVLAAAADSQTLWLGTTLGLMSYNPDTHDKRNWFSLQGGYLVDARTSEPVTAAPSSRLPGAVTALASDGDFLWVATSTRFDPSLSGNGFEGRWTGGYYVLTLQPGVNSGLTLQMGGWRNMYSKNERNYVLLLHKKTGNWVGYFPVTSRVTSLVATEDKLWVGLEDTGYVAFGDHSWEDKEEFTPSPLLLVQKASLISISTNEWISDEIRPDELSAKAQHVAKLLR